MYFNSNEKEHIIVIGGNVSGLAAASQARRNTPNAEITVLESGNYISYGTCGLPYFISGIIDDINKIFVYTPRFFEEERKIKILLNHKVIKLNPQKREIFVQTLESNLQKILNYDKLVICSGAVPFDLGIEVSRLNNVFFFRNVEDTLRLKDFIGKNIPKKAVIVGAGSIGLLMAEALTKIAIKVTVVEKVQRVFSGLEDEISTILQKKLIVEGVAKKIDTFATAITCQMTIDDVYMVDFSYSPGTSTVWDPVNKICGQALPELSKRRF